MKKIHDAILISSIEYYDGQKMVEVNKDTPIKVDVELNIALIGNVHVDIEVGEYKLFH